MLIQEVFVEFTFSKNSDDYFRFTGIVTFKIIFKLTLCFSDVT